MLFRNFYTCARCAHHWNDVWSATCDDDCPSCEARHMSPSRSEDVADPSEQERTRAIRNLNDRSRHALPLGAVMTPGISALGSKAVRDIVQAVATFNRFDSDNDPHGEHDFGALDVSGQRVFFKIDYYDHSLQYGSPDPADPAVTKRVITLMLAEEY